MGINYEMARYTELSGEDGTKVPISRLGGYLDGYEKGKADAERDFQNSDYWNDYLKKVIADARANAIDECIDTLYEVTPQTIDEKLDMVFVNALKQLKE